MKRYFSLVIMCFLIVHCYTQNNKITISLTPKIVTDTYFGNSYNDPYRFLETTEDSTVLDWMYKQGDYKNSYIHNISNRKDLIDKRSKRNKNKEHTYGIKVTDNNRYFYLKSDTNDNTRKLCMRKGFNGREELLFNPQTYKIESGIKYLINFIEPSSNGDKIVISLTKNDEELSEMLILNVETKELLPQVIDHCGPSIIGGVCWLPDNSGFIYTHIPIIDRNSENFLLNTASVLYKLGTDPKKLNVLLSKEKEPGLNFKSEDLAIVYCELENPNYLIGYKGGATFYTDYFYSEVNSNYQDIQWKPLFKADDEVQDLIIFNDAYYFSTANNSPNLKICKTSIKNPDFQHAQVVVEEDPNVVITDLASTSKGIFYVKTKNGVDARLYRYHEGLEQEIEIPKKSGRINITTLGCNSDKLWIDIIGWTFVTEKYSYDFGINSFVAKELYPHSKYPEVENTIIEEIEITSYDGVKVPLSIIYKKGTKLDGTNRLFMSGYGGYGISKKPSFSRYLFEWIAEGGIYAVAHVRGGGEKGEDWHIGGYKATKPNTWKDFIACSEYLIKNNYTSPKYFAIQGSSAGGILIGRAITERPDLFAAAIISGGVLNTMRTEFGQNGKNIARELGTVNDSVEIKYLYEMDAYHHIKDGVKYPAVYIAAGINDARVPAWHSTKFAARLQAANISGKPILLSVDFEGGHGVNAQIDKELEGAIDLLIFAWWQTGHPDYKLKD